MADLELENLGDCIEQIYNGTADVVPWENKNPMAIVDMIDNFIKENF
jgi:prephenate dehydratase